MSEFKDSLVYRTSSRIVRATQKNPVGIQGRTTLLKLHGSREFNIYSD